MDDSSVPEFFLIYGNLSGDYMKNISHFAIEKIFSGIYSNVKGTKVRKPFMLA